MSRRSLPGMLLLFGALAAAVSLLSIPRPQAAQAQAVTCPPGFVWDRLSGVGCVQDRCLDVNAGISRYGYTGNCICHEEYRACYEPVDYAGFDTSQCGPFCPASRLVACVGAGQDCPGEAPPPTASAAISPEGRPPETATVDPLETLRRLLAGGGTAGPTPAQIAAAGAAVASLLGLWLAGSILLGAPPIGSPATQAVAAGLPGIEEIYNADPAKFWQCQDIVWARLYGQAPPASRTSKAEIWQNMQQQGYWEAHQGGMYDPQGTAAKMADLRDGDILMFDLQGLPDVKNAHHYAIVENGKVYQILNFTYPGSTSGEPDIVDLGDAMTFFQPRKVHCLGNGKTYDGQPYYGFRVFRN